jgi:predicted nucleotidyltransferase
VSGEITLLAQEIANRGAFFTTTRWYIFGSVVRGSRAPSDFDILVIYRDSLDTVEIRTRLTDLNLIRPIHLLFMTEAEEQETGFIRAQSCVELYTLPPGREL